MMTSDYLRKRRAQKLDALDRLYQDLHQKATGTLPFEPLTPAGGDVYGGEWPFAVEKASPPCALWLGRASYDWWLPDDSILPLHANALEQSTPHGYYHFLRPNHTETQACLYIHQLDKVGGLAEVAPILDIEHIPDKRPRTKNEKILERWEHENPMGYAWSSQCRSWLDIVENHYDRKAILYGSPATFEVLYSHGQPPAWMTGYDCWLGWYPYSWRINAFRAGPPASVVPSWAGRVVAWQYFQYGRQNGLEPNDLNWVNPAYLEELKA